MTQPPSARCYPYQQDRGHVLHLLGPQASCVWRLGLFLCVQGHHGPGSREVSMSFPWGSRREPDDTPRPRVRLSPRHERCQLPTALSARKTQPLRGRVVSPLFPGVPAAKSWPEGRLGEKYPGMWECVLRKMNLSRKRGLRQERRSNPTGSLSLRAEFCPEGCCGPDGTGYGGYGLGLSPAPGWPWTPGSRGQAERSLSATDDLEGGSLRMP